MSRDYQPIPWAVEGISLINRVLAEAGVTDVIVSPVSKGPSELDLDGLYLQRDVATEVIKALECAGFIHHSDPHGDSYVQHAGDPYGLAYGPSEDEPDCIVFWWYNLTMDV